MIQVPTWVAVVAVPAAAALGLIIGLLLGRRGARREINHLLVLGRRMEMCAREHGATDDDIAPLLDIVSRPIDHIDIIEARTAGRNRR